MKKEQNNSNEYIWKPHKQCYRPSEHDNRAAFLPTFFGLVSSVRFSLLRISQFNLLATTQYFHFLIKYI